MVDVFPDKYSSNNRPIATFWANKVYKYNNGSTIMTLKWDFDELIYQNIALKDVTKVDIFKECTVIHEKSGNSVTIS